MKKLHLGIVTTLAIFLLAFASTAFGQAPDAFVSTTKSNVKNALTRSPMPAETLREMQKPVNGVKVKGPGALFSSAEGKYGFAFNGGETPSRRDLVAGANVGIIYVEANSKTLPNGYYSVQIKQIGTDEKGNPQYGINLFNSSGVQALSIGAKANGTAGNTTGLGAKREAKPQGNTGGVKQGSQVSGTTQARSADYEALGKNIEDSAIIAADCKECTVFMPLFKGIGNVEFLSTEGLDTQIVEMVAAFVGSTKSNVKTA